MPLQQQCRIITKTPRQRCFLLFAYLLSLCYVIAYHNIHLVEAFTISPRTGFTPLCKEGNIALWLKQVSPTEEDDGAPPGVASTVSSVSSTTTCTVEEAPLRSYEILKEMHPLSPPMALVDLSVGEAMAIESLPGNVSIIRVSYDPAIFLLKNFISDDACVLLMDQARMQGMEYAGTSAGNQVSQRRNSFTSWIHPYQDGMPDDDDDSSAGTSNDDNHDHDPSPLKQKAQKITAYMTEVSRLLFTPDYLREKEEEYSSRGGDDEFASMYDAEPLQIVKYDIDGKYDVHHDGLNRFMTILTYLNGVAGTWFPYAEVEESDNRNSPLLDQDIPDMESGAVADDKVVGEDGLVVVSNDDDPSSPLSSSGESRHVVRVDAGDAIVFYNYDWIQTFGDDASTQGGDTVVDSSSSSDEGEIPPTGPMMSWKSIHSGLKTSKEKWIGTNWFYFHE